MWPSSGHWSFLVAVGREESVKGHFGYIKVWFDGFSPAGTFLYKFVEFKLKLQRRMRHCASTTLQCHGIPSMTLRWLIDFRSIEHVWSFVPWEFVCLTIRICTVPLGRELYDYTNSACVCVLLMLQDVPRTDSWLCQYWPWHPQVWSSMF